jgi:hypothetical protein
MISKFLKGPLLNTTTMGMKFQHEIWRDTSTQTTEYSSKQTSSSLEVYSEKNVVPHFLALFN